jgi:hypothetical protein
MAITQAVCTSFKQELLVGTHNFTATTGDTFKIALYSSSATLSASTTAYSSSNEVSASGTYTAGGGSLTNVTPTTSGTTALTDFSDISFTSATITARGALIYNSSDSIKRLLYWTLVAIKRQQAEHLQFNFQQQMQVTLFTISIGDKIWL